MLHGFINVNKPAGMTSHNVVAKLRRILKMKKIGHTGTLDPQVTGVLPIAVGQATKLTEYLLEADKTYEGSMILGISTDTEDITGNITKQAIIDDTQIIDKNLTQKLMDKMIGKIQQVPPMYSAVKIGGKKLYEIARAGKEIHREARTINIYSFDCLNLSTTIIDNKAYPVINFRVSCSKGTYIRTLCVQLGELFGLPACMNSLVRISTANFHIRDSFSLEDIEQLVLNDEIDSFLIKMDIPFDEMPSINLTDNWSKKVINGMQYIEKATQTNDTYFKLIGQLFKMYDINDNLIAIYRLININNDNYIWKAEKVFREAVQYE